MRSASKPSTSCRASGGSSLAWCDWSSSSSPDPIPAPSAASRSSRARCGFPARRSTRTPRPATSGLRSTTSPTNSNASSAIIAANASAGGTGEYDSREVRYLLLPIPLGEMTKDAKDDAADKLRVMIVDDHALFRRGLEMVLQSEDDLMLVGEASDGEEAVEKAQELMPDVVLM